MTYTLNITSLHATSKDDALKAIATAAESFSPGSTYRYVGFEARPVFLTKAGTGENVLLHYMVDAVIAFGGQPGDNTEEEKMLLDSIKGPHKSAHFNPSDRVCFRNEANPQVYKVITANVSGTSLAIKPEHGGRYTWVDADLLKLVGP